MKPKLTMTEVKIKAIHDALVYYNGNKVHAATALEYNVRTIRNMVRRHPELAKFKREKYGASDQPRTKDGQYARRDSEPPVLHKTRDGDE